MRRHRPAVRRICLSSLLCLALALAWCVAGAAVGSDLQSPGANQGDHKEKPDKAPTPAKPDKGNNGQGTVVKAAAQVST